MVMLKFHERDDIFALKLMPPVVGRPHIEATIPGGYVEPGAYIRLIAPSFNVDEVVKVIRTERQIDKTGDLSTIGGEFVS